MTSSYDVLISGAGMVGAALGLALSRMGLQVLVAERRSEAQCAAPDPIQRCSLVNAGASNLLAALGVDPAALGTPVARMRVWDAEHAGGIHLDASEVDAPLLGYIVENQILEQALRNALQGAGGEIRYHCQWQYVATDPTAIIVEDQHQQLSQARLLVIAEGRQSPLRSALFHGSILREDYQQDAIVATIGIERPHLGTAYQRFLPTGPLALLPFRDDEHGRPQASLVWSARRWRSKSLQAMEDEPFLRDLQEVFGPTLGQLRSIGKRASFPLSALHVNGYVQERAILLGDSAHGVHPLAGLGVNLGFRDVAAVQQLILQARKDRQDWGALPRLRQYERDRRADNLATVLACSGLNHLFSNRSILLARLRDLGLWGTGMTPPLKRFFIRQAMGL